MQTIKVKVIKRDAEKSTCFAIDDKVIATVSPDFRMLGKFTGVFGSFGCCSNQDESTAIDFISGCITNHFLQFGINITFIL